MMEKTELILNQIIEMNGKMGAVEQHLGDINGRLNRQDIHIESVRTEIKTVKTSVTKNTLQIYKISALVSAAGIAIGGTAAKIINFFK